jgi:hypothetical protein
MMGPGGEPNAAFPSRLVALSAMARSVCTASWIADPGEGNEAASAVSSMVAS